MKAFAIPFAKTMCTMDGEKASVLPTISSTKSNAKVLSTIKFKKGLRRDENYLAILKERDDEEMPSQPTIPQKVYIIFDEYKDVMPEVPKKLPPRKETNHQIALKLKDKPPSIGHYHIRPLELAKLKK